MCFFSHSCILPGFCFLGSSPDFGFPTDSCDLLSLRALSMSLDKPGALYEVTCSAGILRQLHLEVLVSNLKFLLLPYVCRPLVSKV